jgi:hypothetical protein
VGEPLRHFRGILTGVPVPIDGVAAPPVTNTATRQATATARPQLHDADSGTPQNRATRHRATPSFAC